MPMGNRTFSDKKENYVDSYVLSVNGSTSTALNGEQVSQPIAVFALNFFGNAGAGASGEVALIDASSSADTSTLKFRTRIASGASQAVTNFTRPLYFDKGVIVSAVTVTGAVNILFKVRST